MPVWTALLVSTGRLVLLAPRFRVLNHRLQLFNQLLPYCHCLSIGGNVAIDEVQWDVLGLGHSQDQQAIIA